MATHTHVTFTCDTPECKSRCQLLPEVAVGDPAVLVEEFAKRGWFITDSGKHLCPFHAGELRRTGQPKVKQVETQ